MTLDYSALKEKLVAEKKKLETELGHLGHKDPQSGAWEATAKDNTEKQGELENEPEPDIVDGANRIEDFEERFSVDAPLRARLAEVEMAIWAMGAGTYGWCMIGGEKHQIEEGRLLANPAAVTCMEHKE